MDIIIILKLVMEMNIWDGWYMVELNQNESTKGYAKLYRNANSCGQLHYIKKIYMMQKKNTDSLSVNRSKQTHRSRKWNQRQDYTSETQLITWNNHITEVDTME